MSTPAGWYPDPSGSTSQLRWWDGQAWTDHVHTPEAPVDLDKSEPWSDRGQGRDPYQSQVPWTAGQWPDVDARQTHTPDGQPFGSLGLRLVARIIDFVLFWIIAVIAAQGPMLILSQRLQVWTDQFARAVEAGATPPPTPSLMSLNEDGVVVQVLLVVFVLSLLYNVLFTRFLGATPGKLACRLRVRAWDRPGLPTWGQAILRWLTREVAANLTFVGILYWMLDSLWPLWDKRRQGLHDKLGKTVVVRR